MYGRRYIFYDANHSIWQITQLRSINRIPVSRGCGESATQDIHPTSPENTITLKRVNKSIIGSIVV